MSLLFPSLSPSAALADDGKFLLAARRSHRPAGTEYLISLDAKNTSKGTYIGKLRWAFKKQCLKFKTCSVFSMPCIGSKVWLWQRPRFTIFFSVNQIKLLGNKIYCLWCPSTLCRSCGFKGSVCTHDRFSPSFSWGVCTHGPSAHIIVLLLSFEILTYCFCIFNLSSLSSMPI